MDVPWMEAPRIDTPQMDTSQGDAPRIGCARIDTAAGRPSLRLQRGQRIAHGSERARDLRRVFRRMGLIGQFEQRAGIVQGA